MKDKRESKGARKNIERRSGFIRERGTYIRTPKRSGGGGKRNRRAGEKVRAMKLHLSSTALHVNGIRPTRTKEERGIKRSIPRGGRNRGERRKNHALAEGTRSLK